jgi:hypothetical protein
MKIKISDYSKLERLLESRKPDYYFRGFSKSEQMICTLGRKNPYEKRENELLLNFVTNIEIQKLNLRSFRKAIELGQHYGLPTRLLDWSINPYISLFFAIGQEQKINNSPIYIALLNRKDPILKDIRDFSSIDLSLYDLTNKTVSAAENLFLSQISKFDITAEHQNFEEYISSQIFWDAYKKYISSSPDLIFFGYEKDTIINLRKEAQLGVFSYHANCKKPFPKENYDLLEINFSSVQKLKVLQTLNDLGYKKDYLLPINPICPYLEEICKNIRN